MTAYYYKLYLGSDLVNKKECINLINELFEKLDDAKRQIFELENELQIQKENSASTIIVKEETSKEEVKEEKTETEISEQPDETYEEEMAVEETCETEETLEVEETPNEEEPVNELESEKASIIDEKVVLELAQEITLPEIKTSDEFQVVCEDVLYAAEILSKILVAAEKYLNMSDTTQSVKDLIISQIKTAKQTIVSLLLVDTDISEKKIFIYNVYNSTLDYFEGLIND